MSENSTKNLPYLQAIQYPFLILERISITEERDSNFSDKDFVITFLILFFWLNFYMDGIGILLILYIFFVSYHLSVGICHAPHTQTGECDTKPFLRWVWAQDCSPDTPDILKNASGSIGIPLKTRASDAKW